MSNAGWLWPIVLSALKSVLLLVLLALAGISAMRGLATAISSSMAPSDPAPARMATFSPAFRMSAALCRSVCVGITRGNV